MRAGARFNTGKPATPKPPHAASRASQVQYHVKHFNENPGQHARALRSLGLPKNSIRTIADEAKRSRVLGKYRMAGMGMTGQNVFNAATKTITSGGKELAGIGPGMYHLTGGLIHHPVPTIKQVGKATYHSFGETVNHPLRQLENDPLGLAANLSVAFAVPGRALGTASELGRASSAADIARAVAKPRRPIREPYAPGATPLASGNRGVALVQKHVIDRIVRHTLKHPQGELSKWLNTPHIGRLVGPETKIGREMRAGQRVTANADVGIEAKIARYSKQLSDPEKKALMVDASRRSPRAWANMEANALRLGSAGDQAQLRLTQAAMQYFKGGKLEPRLQQIQDEMRQAAREREALRVQRGAATEEQHLFRLGAHSLAIKHGAEGFNGANVLQEFARLSRPDSEKLQAARSRVARLDERATRAAAREFTSSPKGPSRLPEHLGGHGAGPREARLTAALSVAKEELQRLEKNGGSPEQAAKLRDQIIAEGRRVHEQGGYYLPVKEERKLFASVRGGRANTARGTSISPPRPRKDYHYTGAALATGKYGSNVPRMVAGGLRYERELARATRNYEQLWAHGVATPEEVPGGPELAHPIRSTLQIPEHMKEQAYGPTVGAFKKGEAPGDVIAQIWAHNLRPPGPHEDVRYISTHRLHPLQPYVRGKVTGSMGEFLDRANQIVRFGRFLGPQYAVKWLPQNAIVVATDHGALAIRNLGDYVTKIKKMNPVTYEKWARLAGSGAALSLPGETRFLSRSMHATAHFFHKAVDHIPRMLIAIHQARAEGFVSQAQMEALADGAPVEVRGKMLSAAEVKAARERVFRHSNQRAIDYGAQTPGERATLKKLFTSWPWTSAASRWTGRFVVEHPYQSEVYAEAGREGKRSLFDYWKKQGGPVPLWLQSELMHKPNAKGIATGLNTSILNPGETPGSFGQGFMGLMRGDKSAARELTGGYAPATSAVFNTLFGVATGKGKAGVAANAQELARRFQPIGALELARRTTGSLQGGGRAGLERYTGVPLEQVDVKKAAAGSLRDERAAMSKQQRVTADVNDFHTKAQKVLASHGVEKLPRFYAARLNLWHERLTARANAAKGWEAKVLADLSVIHAHGWIDADQYAAAKANLAKAPKDKHGAITRELTDTYFDRDGLLHTGAKEMGLKVPSLNR